MKLVIVFVLIFYCILNANCNQQNDDPTKPFWATRGRRSGPGGRFLMRSKLEDENIIPGGKWAEEDDPAADPLDKEALLPKREQAMSILQSLLNSLSPWDGDVIKKRGDPKTFDPNNPFWAARG